MADPQCPERNARLYVREHQTSIAFGSVSFISGTIAVGQPFESCENARLEADTTET